MNISIGTIDTQVEPDPYRLDTSGSSGTEMVIHPARQHVWVRQFYPGQKGIPHDEYHNLVICLPIMAVDEKELYAYLHGDYGQDRRGPWN